MKIQLEMQNGHICKEFEDDGGAAEVYIDTLSPLPVIEFEGRHFTYADAGDGWMKFEETMKIMVL